ncbi:MAG: hypothetical protein ACP6IP_09900 [Candidatus Njordarchaeia archaeon]
MKERTISFINADFFGVKFRGPVRQYNRLMKPRTVLANSDRPPVYNDADANKNDYDITVFLLQELLDFSQALAYLDVYREPRGVEEGVLIGFIEEWDEDVGDDVEKVAEILGVMTVIGIVQDEMRNEMDKLKDEKRRKWSRKTTYDKLEKRVDKLYDKLFDDKRLYEVIVDNVSEFARVYGPPYRYGGRGPRLKFDPVKITSILVFKGAKRIGNGQLLSMLKSWNVSALIRGEGVEDALPSESLLRKVMDKEEFVEWLDAFTVWLLLRKAFGYLKYYNRAEYVSDGTDEKTNRLEVAIRGGKKVLRQETIPVKFTYNINLDMYLHVDVTTSRKLDRVITLLSPGDVLMTDPEFFTRENCYMALSKGIVVAIKPNKSAKKSPELRECKDKFNVKQYKARKNGERGAKIYNDTVMRYVDPHRRRVMVKLMAAGYNIKRLVKLAIKYTLVMTPVTTVKIQV